MLDKVQKRKSLGSLTIEPAFVLLLLVVPSLLAVVLVDLGLLIVVARCGHGVVEEVVAGGLHTDKVVTDVIDAHLELGSSQDLPLTVVLQLARSHGPRLPRLL